jgi:hypothetical protein
MNMKLVKVGEFGTDRTCGTDVADKQCMQNCNWETSWKDQDIDVKLVSKLIVQKQDVGILSGLNNSEQGLLVLDILVP